MKLSSVRSSLRVCLLLLSASLFPISAPAQSSSSANAAPPPLANAVILVIRHAEKPADGTGDDPGLAPAGQRRAAAYVRYFQTYTVGTMPLHVSHLIASADTKRSQRPRLTVEPFSQASGLIIDTRFRDKDADALAAALASEPGGKTILICWHHTEIPALLQDLGANPDALLPHGKWPSGIYDWVIQLRYDRAGRLIAGQAQRIQEHLLPGDE